MTKCSAAGWGDSPRARASKRSTPYEIIILPQLGRLAWERLQIDTDLLPIITSTADELYGGNNIDDLEWLWTPRIGVLVNFIRDLRLPHTFQEWTGPKSLEIDQDNLRMKCSALNVHFNTFKQHNFRPPGLRSPYECIEFGYPQQNARFLLLSTSLSTAADRHRLTAIHNKHCWRAFRGYQHRWPWTTLNPKDRDFSEFFAISGCDAHLEWIFA